MLHKLKMFVNKLKVFVPTLAILIPLLFFILADSSVQIVSAPSVSSNQATIRDYQYNNRLLGENNDALLQQINKDNEKSYSDVLNSLLPKEKLTELARSSWAYYLNVNSAAITKENQTIDAKSSTIQIVLVEELVSDKLPVDVARLGTVEGESNVKLENSIKLTATKAKYEVTVDTQGQKTIVTYKFTGVEVGEIITLQLNTNLKNQLKLDNEVIEIFNSQISS